MITSVIIDSREPDWVKGLKFGGVPTAVTALDAGDFLVATSDGVLLSIERKTSDDLLNTLKGDRLFSQCARIRAATPWAYLLITGYLGPGPDGKTITTRQTGWDFSAVQGALLTVQELGVNVVFSSGIRTLRIQSFAWVNGSMGTCALPHLGYQPSWGQVKQPLQRCQESEWNA